MTKEEIIDLICDFAKDRLVDEVINLNSPKETWKQAGRRDVLNDLLHFLKELREK